MSGYYRPTFILILTLHILMFTGSSAHVIPYKFMAALETVLIFQPPSSSH